MICVFFTLFIIIVYLVTYVYYKFKLATTKQTITDIQHEINEKEQTIEKLSDNFMTSTQEIRKLKKEIKTLQEETIKATVNGMERYNELEKGCTIVLWQKQDLADFIEYYKFINKDFWENLRKDYQNLTDRQIIYAILSHMRKSDVDIASIMGVEIATIRIQRMRLKNKKTKNLVVKYVVIIPRMYKNLSVRRIQAKSVILC